MSKKETPLGKLLKFKRTRKTKARTKAKPVAQIDLTEDMAMQLAKAMRAMVTDADAEAFRRMMEGD